MAVIRFRPVTPEDYPKILDWLSAEHLKPWWDDGHTTLAQVSTAYSRNPASTFRFVAAEDEREFGYFQYWREDGVAGVDQFLAFEKDLDQGLGTRALSAFLEHLRTLGIRDEITVDPHVENKRAIRCYEKCGFTFDPARSSETVHFMTRGNG